MTAKNPRWPPRIFFWHFNIRPGWFPAIHPDRLVRPGTHIYNSLLNKFCSLRNIQMSIFLELFQKNSFLTIYIHISKGRNLINNCAIDQIFFYRFRTFQLSFFCSCVVFKCQYFLELFKKNSFLTIYIHISKGRNSVKNCSIDQIFFSTCSEQSNDFFFCSWSLITF